jgi:hypothetical protein
MLSDLVALSVMILKIKVSLRVTEGNVAIRRYERSAAISYNKLSLRGA